MSDVGFPCLLSCSSCLRYPVTCVLSVSFATDFATGVCAASLHDDHLTYIVVRDGEIRGGT